MLVQVQTLLSVAATGNMLLMTRKAASARQNKSPHRAKTPAAKMRDYRARLKAMGLKPKQIWAYLRQAETGCRDPVGYF